MFLESSLHWKVFPLRELLCIIFLNHRLHSAKMSDYFTVESIRFKTLVNNNKIFSKLINCKTSGKFNKIVWGIFVSKLRFSKLSECKLDSEVRPF